MSLINIKAIKAAEAAHKRLFEKARKAINELPVPKETKDEASKIINDKYTSSLHDILQAGLLPPAQPKTAEATATTPAETPTINAPQPEPQAQVTMDPNLF